jgi:hypothetical protein
MSYLAVFLGLAYCGISPSLSEFCDCLHLRFISQQRLASMDSLQQQYWARYEEAGELLKTDNVQEGRDLVVGNSGSHEPLLAIC